MSRPSTLASFVLLLLAGVFFLWWEVSEIISAYAASN